ncbi:MAG TPA: hypothetical protein VF898_01895, partial [Chloroflexota bacterium]
MSAQLAIPSPRKTPDALTPSPRSRPRRRWFRLFFGFFLAFLLSLLLSGAVVIFNPAVLEGMSAILLKPQPGAIPWNGHDRITVVAMGLTQRTT